MSLRVYNNASRKDDKWPRAFRKEGTGYPIRTKTQQVLAEDEENAEWAVEEGG